MLKSVLNRIRWLCLQYLEGPLTEQQIKQRIMDFLYNEDRALASLAGAAPQETISSEAGRLQNTELWARILSDVLDTIQKQHVERAESHAEALDKADTGFEG